MKRYNLHIITLILLSLSGMFACTDDEITKKESVIDGIPTVVTFGFKTEDLAKVMTKSQLSDAAEAKVNDLFVLIFHEEQGEWTVEKSDWVTGIGDKTNGSFSWKITSGPKRIFAVANSKGSVYKLSTLENIQTLEEFKKLSSQLSSEDIFRTGSLLMSGSYGGTDDGSVEISTTEGKVYDGIKLKRIDSRITFDVTCTKSGAKFTPNEWFVVNVPRKSYVLGRSGQYDDLVGNEKTATGFELENYYFTSKPKNFENFKNDEKGGGDFTFYMAENKRKALKSISDYQERERQRKEQTADGYYKNMEFLNVEPEATYVVMRGTYTEGAELRAEVQYTVHLGYVENIVSDFESNRNKAYIYSVKIGGVDNIRTEVTTGKENQPGAEGDIVVSQELKLADAHYDIQSITFDLKKVSEHASFAIKTPFDEGGYTYGLPCTAKDYEWVQFLENPGSALQAYPKDGKGLKNIKQVIDYLQDKINKGQTKGQFKFTVFIDEYYYKNNPIPEQGIYSRASWKEFVNKPNREMQILCNTDYSPDKASSLTTSSFMISQRSIKTFYSVDNSTIKTAWGIETVREGNRVHCNMVQSGSKENGYSVMAGYRDKNWSSYINVANNIVKSDDNNALYACLQRNRDLDGDNKIDGDEIKWYMPAVNQMTGIWLGKDGLPSETHLVQNGIQSKITQDSYAYLYHFITSDRMIFWAEEGSSTSNNVSNYGTGSATTTTISQSTGRYYDYRCVRNLNDDIDNVTAISTIPEDYVGYENNIFTLDKLNSKSLRGSIANSQQSVENELHSNNLPYVSFQVAASNVNGIEYTRENVRKDITPCSSYNEDNNSEGAGAWRMPNQRELSLMCAYGSWVNILYSNTKSSLPTRPSSIYSLMKRDGVDIIALSAASARIRCVRDIPIKK